MTKHSEVAKTYAVPTPQNKGGGAGSAGQSGDTQGLPDVAEAGSESVQELVEEGQYFEAGVLLGVEKAAEVDMAELQTREVLEDGVPSEYLGEDAGR